MRVGDDGCESAGAQDRDPREPLQIVRHRVRRRRAGFVPTCSRRTWPRFATGKPGEMIDKVRAAEARELKAQGKRYENLSEVQQAYPAKLNLRIPQT